LKDEEPRLPSVFDPFMEVSGEKEKTLLLTINQGKKCVALTIEK